MNVDVCWPPLSLSFGGSWLIVDNFGKQGNWDLKIGQYFSSLSLGPHRAEMMYVLFHESVPCVLFSFSFPLMTLLYPKLYGKRIKRSWICFGALLSMTGCWMFYLNLSNRYPFLTLAATAAAWSLCGLNNWESRKTTLKAFFQSLCPYTYSMLRGDCNLFVLTLVFKAFYSFLHFISFW